RPPASVALSTLSLHDALPIFDPHACATAEMVYRLARHAGVSISPEVATCLYTAVLTDTGSFSYMGTNERTFTLARELVLCGADRSEEHTSELQSRFDLVCRLL